MCMCTRQIEPDLFLFLWRTTSCCTFQIDFHGQIDLCQAYASASRRTDGFISLAIWTRQSSMNINTRHKIDHRCHRRGWRRLSRRRTARNSGMRTPINHVGKSKAQREALSTCLEARWISTHATTPKYQANQKQNFSASTKIYSTCVYDALWIKGMMHPDVLAIGTRQIKRGTQ